MAPTGYWKMGRCADVSVPRRRWVPRTPRQPRTTSYTLRTPDDCRVGPVTAPKPNVVPAYAVLSHGAQLATCMRLHGRYWGLVTASRTAQSHPEPLVHIAFLRYKAREW